jgi:hypothetical protein
MNVVSGGKRTFYMFQPMNTLFYRFEWWYPLWLNDTLDVLISIGTLCDLSMCWIHLMVLGFMVKKLEWYPKLNVLWVFKWKPRVWVVGFDLVNSLALVPFNLHISFHLFYLVFCPWINSQTFGTRLKWSWLSKTPIFDHFPVDSTSYLHTLYCKRFVCCEYYLKHTSSFWRRCRGNRFKNWFLFDWFCFSTS